MSFLSATDCKTRRVDEIELERTDLDLRSLSILALGLDHLMTQRFLQRSLAKPREGSNCGVKTDEATRCLLRTSATGVIAWSHGPSRLFMPFIDAICFLPFLLRTSCPFLCPSRVFAMLQTKTRSRILCNASITRQRLLRLAHLSHDLELSSSGRLSTNDPSRQISEAPQTVLTLCHFAMDLTLPTRRPSLALLTSSRLR